MISLRAYRMPVSTTSKKVLSVPALNLHSLKLKFVASATMDFEAGTITSGTPYEAGESFSMSHLDFIRDELDPEDIINIWCVAAVATNVDVTVIRR